MNKDKDLVEAAIELAKEAGFSISQSGTIRVSAMNGGCTGQVINLIRIVEKRTRDAILSIKDQQAQPVVHQERESKMAQWDSWRKYIANGGTASWPRDEFECLLDGYDESIAELEAKKVIADRLIVKKDRQAQPENNRCPVCTQFGESKDCPLCDGHGTAPSWCDAAHQAPAEQDQSGDVNDMVADGKAPN